MPRSIPLSVRVSDDDAAFLAKFEAPGARTPSEKLRAILKSARERHEGSRDFAGCANMMAEMLRPALSRVRQAQRDAGLRSEFVLRLYERMPELMAELLSAAPQEEQNDADLKAFEQALADQVFALVEEIMDMGLTSRSRSYDPALVQDRLEPVLEILELINTRRKKEGETK